MRVQSDLADQAIAMFPSTIVDRFTTRVIRFLNDSEQRWTLHDKLHGLVLEYHNVCGYDVSVLRDFFRLRKGRYVGASLTNSFDLKLGGVTYNYCVFDQDDFVVTEDAGKPNTYNFVLRIKILRRN